MSNIIKPTLVQESPVFCRSGYSVHSMMIAKSLLKYDKFDLKIVPTRWGGCPQIDLDLLGQSDEQLRQLISKVKTQFTERPEVHCQISIPNEFRPMGKYNIGITAGIESTICAGTWIEGLNRMNVVIVPSKFSKDVLVSTQYNKKHEDGRMEELKCKVPIEVIFEGINTNIYKKTSQINAGISEKLSAIKENWCFLFVGHWMHGELGADRKDVGMLIKVFCETFKNKKDKPALILKTSGATLSIIDRDDILRKIAAIRQSLSGDIPNVYLIHGDLLDEEMNSLYNHPKVKAHISLTHGEGYGLPLAEASLSGKPLIVTGWSGHMDFCHKEYCNIVPVTIQPVPQSAVNDWIIKESKWAVANYSIAAQLMENVYNDYDKYLPNAEKQRKHVEENFSFEKMNMLLHSTLDKYIPQFEQKVELVLPKFKKLETVKEIVVPADDKPKSQSLA